MSQTDEFITDGATAPRMQQSSIVMSRMRPWLDDGGNRTMKAQQRVNQVANADARGRASGTGRIRSSMIGDCQRKQALSFLGVPQSDPPPWESIMLMNSGTYMHYYIQTAGLSDGWLRDIEVPCTLDITDEVQYVGAIDGILFDDSIFEFKSAGYGKFKAIAEAPDPQHVMQVTGYMIARNVNHATILYCLRDNPSKHREYRVKRNDLLVEQFWHNARTVAAATLENVPEPLASCTFGESPYTTCNWRTVCRPGGNPEGGPVTFYV